MIVLLRKIARPVVAAAVLAMFGLLLVGVLDYAGQRRGSKVDNSNAVQVVKPVPTETVTAGAAGDFFTEYRLERDKIRSERSDLLREIIKDAKSEDSRQKAQDAVLKLMLEKQREAEMENLIRARGFADALVVMRDNSVSAIVKTQALTRDEVMQVADVIGRIAGVKPEDIVISAKP
jgi:stage III sporulation protein AH